MSVQVLDRPGARAASARRPVPAAAPAPATADLWPHTSRPLPWLLAAFVVTIFLVPFQAVELPISAPIDLTLDRVVIGAITFTWLVDRAQRGFPVAGVTRNVIVLGLALFVVCSIVSVLLNVSTLINLGESGLVVKKLLLLLGAQLALFAVAATSLRAIEVSRLMRLAVGLGVVTALGTIWEYRTEYNVFFAVADAIPWLTTTPDIAGIDSIGRPNINGPTAHGLAVATILAMALPFATIGFLAAQERKERIRQGLMMVLLLAGAIATLKKTAVIVPAVSFLVTLAYRPPGWRRLLPVLVVAIIATKFMAPEALGNIKGQLIRGGTDAPVSGRTDDYAAVKPDIAAHPLLGRGFGSFDAKTYRFLDNQYMGFMIEIGLLGTLAFLWMIVSVLAHGHRTIRGPDRAAAAYCLAAGAAAIAFAVANVLYDALGFAQGTYLFLLLAAGTVVVVRESRMGLAAGEVRP